MIAQNKDYRLNVTAGSFIQQYNGNLGNSFFKFNSTCFGGVGINFGVYLNKSFDLNIGASVSRLGYCQTDEDSKRVVSLEYRCPGCTNRLGMGELRSQMISGNLAARYKFANGYLLKEDARFAPYIFAGVGINQLSDIMKRNCVNVGTHYTINGGAGIKYNITRQLNVGYQLSVGCFMAKKVYATNGTVANAGDKDETDIKMEHRKDLYMQNTLLIGFNF